MLIRDSGFTALRSSSTGGGGRTAASACSGSSAGSSSAGGQQVLYPPVPAPLAAPTDVAQRPVSRSLRSPTCSTAVAGCLGSTQQRGWDVGRSGELTQQQQQQQQQQRIAAGAAKGTQQHDLGGKRPAALAAAAWTAPARGDGGGGMRDVGRSCASLRDDPELAAARKPRGAEASAVGHSGGRRSSRKATHSAAVGWSVDTFLCRGCGGDGRGQSVAPPLRTSTPTPPAFTCVTDAVGDVLGCVAATDPEQQPVERWCVPSEQAGAVPYAAPPPCFPVRAITEEPTAPPA